MMGQISIDTLKNESIAIIDAYYPEDGKAIAETLFGFNNPSGKLPYTIYPAEDVYATDFLSMNMTVCEKVPYGRSYKYYT